jgi:hypothetical protein
MGLLFTIAAGLRQRSHCQVESRRAHDQILLSQIRDSPKLESQVPVNISPRNRVAHLYPRQWVPFSSPPTTRRATVEVFDPNSTRDLYTEEFLKPNIYKFSSYLTGNTLCLRYRDQPVNAVWGNSRCLLWESYGTHKSTVWAESRNFIYKHWVRTSQETHYVSATKPSRLMLFGEIIAVYCENHTEHTNTLCGQNAEFWILKQMVHIVTNGFQRVKVEQSKWIIHCLFLSLKVI